MTVKCGEFFFLDKFFLGVDGFVPEYGFTGQDHMCVETAIELAKRAKKVFVLTESAKFKRRGICNLIKLNKLSGVCTDDGIPNEAEAVLLGNNVRLHKVPSSEEKISWARFPGQPPVLYTKKQDQ
jgi:DeoR/GlpR family transcriptional regulator of sugar metabolism